MTPTSPSGVMKRIPPLKSTDPAQVAAVRERGQRPHPGELVENVVIPVEGSTKELVAQQWAVEIAAALGARVRAVHATLGAEDPPDDVFDYLRGLCKDRGVAFERQVVHAQDVAAELTSELSATDLVVIGTRRLGTEWHQGSVAEALIRSAPCPVQVVRID